MGKRFLIVFIFLAGLAIFGYLLSKKPSLSQQVSPLPSPLASISNITVQSDRLSYSPEDIIKVTLSNQSKDFIYFTDHQSNCTVVTIQRLIGKDWQAENQCALMTQTITFSLEGNKSTILELTALPTGWVKGMYRAAMVMYAQNNNKEHPVTILSPVFQIQ